MSNKQRILFVFNCVYTLMLYYSYYHSTVFQQQSIHIDSIWVVLKFFLVYGSPFLIAACLVDKWGIGKAYTMSIVIWLCVYSFEAVTKSKQFTLLYPDGYQCLLVAITVYPGIGLSVLFGHFVGKLGNIFIGKNSQEVKDSVNRDKKFSWIKR